MSKRPFAGRRGDFRGLRGISEVLWIEIKAKVKPYFALAAVCEAEDQSSSEKDDQQYAA